MCFHEEKIFSFILLHIYSGAADPGGQGGQLPTQYLRESPLGGKKFVQKIFFVPYKKISAHPIQNPFRRP